LRYALHMRYRKKRCEGRQRGQKVVLLELPYESTMPKWLMVKTTLII